MIEIMLFFSPSSNFHIHEANKSETKAKIITKNKNLPLVWVLWDQLRLEDLAAELLNGF